MTPDPVSSFRNREFHGMALSCDQVFEGDLAEIEALRAQQAAYLESLPTDPAECISAALRHLGPNGGNYPDGFEEAMHLSHALVPMIKAPGYGEPGHEQDALLWIADRIQYGLQRAAAGIDRAGDILGNPARVELDARRAAMGPFRRS